MKRLFFLLLLPLFGVVMAQTYEITYNSSFEGKTNPRQDATVVIADQNNTYIVRQSILEGKTKFPYEVTTTAWPTEEVKHYAFLNEQKLISTVEDSVFAKQKFEITDETKKILGYKVRKAKTTVRSNSIEVWFADQPGIKAGPSTLGEDLGLVLETVRNGSFAVTATSVKKIKGFDAQTLFNGKNAEQLDYLSYNDEIWRSRFTTIPVFTNEVINFVKEPKQGDGILRFANGTIILKKIKFPDIKENESVFVELKEQSNGDAYDRTGSVFIIPEGRSLSFFDGLEKGADKLPVYPSGSGKDFPGITLTPNYLPAQELMRFFTPFGISHFNNQVRLKGKNWHDIVPYRQEISELKPELNGKEIWVGTYIGNYDGGGHKVSLEFTIHPSASKFKNNFALPLFTTTNIMEMAGQTYPTLFDSDKGLEVEFTLDKEIKKAQLRYITTGHGGWGNGDEFVPTKNTIFLDGKEAFSYTPWRTDCGTYRLYNPSSGNFANGLSSSDLSRSTWCPGTVTIPVFIDLGDLKAGTHQITVKIPQGAPEGSSFSYWNVSGTLLGDQE